MQSEPVIPRGGVLSRADLREQIAIAVADAKGCDYCLSPHTALGHALGASEAELRARVARVGEACCHHGAARPASA